MRPDLRHSALALLQRELNILTRVCRRDGALLGRDGHKEYAQRIERAAQLQIACKIMLQHDVVEIHGSLRHQIKREGAALASDTSRHAMRSKYFTQPSLDHLAQLLQACVQLGPIRQ